MKYIIDLEPFTFDEDSFPALWKAQEFNTLFFDNYGVGKLKPLCNDSCIEHLQESGWMLKHDKEIYEHGYNDSLAVLKFTDGAELYAKGQKSAWEAARKIICPKTTDEWIDLGKALNAIPDKAYWVIMEKEPEEVIRILDDYDRQKADEQDEIRIGDEVSFHYDDRPDLVMVVTDIYDEAGKVHICGMDARGMQYAGKLAECWEKTGRHFDQVSELLRAMRVNDG